MRRTTILFLAAALVPISATAQQDPMERLAEVLPPEISAQVLERIETARAQDLPSQAVANLVLEGVAKGRSSGEVLAAVEVLVADMGRALDALQNAGRAPAAGEVEAATAAMRLGVDATEVSDLARSQASGRTLAVPLLVLGGLAERGLPSDEALAAVRERLAAGADDARLLADLPEAAAGLGQPMQAAGGGLALASGFAGFQVPVGGINVPVGPQAEGVTKPGRGPAGLPIPPQPPIGSPAGGRPNG